MEKENPVPRAGGNRAGFDMRCGVEFGLYHREIQEAPTVARIGTAADRVWHQFRSAIIERQRHPSAALDLRIRHLRQELVAALEDPGAA